MVTPFANGTLLRAAAHAPAVDVDALAGRGVLVLAPHPDDETLGCGAALATLARRAHPIRVVVVTDGGGSHPHSRCWPHARLVARRADELAAALDALGDGRIAHERLGFPDQGIPDASNAVVRDALERLSGMLAESGSIDTIWTTWEGDPHPDHARTADLAEALADAHLATSGLRPTVIRFPIWGRFVERSPTSARDELVRLVPDGPARARKSRALACHASQMSALIDDDPEGFTMPRTMQRHFIEHDELFVRERTG